MWFVVLPMLLLWVLQYFRDGISHQDEGTLLLTAVKNILPQPTPDLAVDALYL